MTEIRSDSGGIYVEAGGRYARPLRGQGEGLEAGRHVRAALNAEETEVRVRWSGNEEMWPAAVSRRAGRPPAPFKYELGQKYEDQTGRVHTIREVYGSTHRYYTEYDIRARCESDNFYNELGYEGSSKAKQVPDNPKNLKPLAR